MMEANGSKNHFIFLSYYFGAVRVRLVQLPISGDEAPTDGNFTYKNDYGRFSSANLIPNAKSTKPLIP